MHLLNVEAIGPAIVIVSQFSRPNGGPFVGIAMNKGFEAYRTWNAYDSPQEALEAVIKWRAIRSFETAEARKDEDADRMADSPNDAQPCNCEDYPC